MVCMGEFPIPSILGGHSWALVAFALIWATRDIVLFLLIPRTDRANALRATTENNSSDEGVTG